MEGNFSNSVRDVISYSREEAIRLGHEHIGPEHLLLGIIQEIQEGKATAAKILRNLGCDALNLKKAVEEEVRSTGDAPTVGNIPLTNQAEKILKVSYLEAKLYKSDVIQTEHLLLSLLRDDENIAAQILNERFSITYDEVHAELVSIIGAKSSPRSRGSDSGASGGSTGFKALGERKRRSTPVLDKFCQNLIEDHGLHRVVGREPEITQLTRHLLRRSNNNVVLVGQSGVGKTAIVEGLALRIAMRNAKMPLWDKSIRSLDVSSISAGTPNKDQVLADAKALVRELENNDDVFLFIDDLSALFEASSVVAGVFLPALDRGTMQQCIGTMTPNDYYHHVDKNKVLRRRFNQVLVEPTAIPDTIQVLHEIRDKFEYHHNVNYTDEAIELAVTLSDRFISDRYLPEKAIDVMDRAGTRVHLHSMGNSQEIEQLLEQIEEVREEKNRVIRNQRFEEAARLRDTEKKLEEQLESTSRDYRDKVEQQIHDVTASDVYEVLHDETGIPLDELLERSASVVAYSPEVGNEERDGPPIFISYRRDSAGHVVGRIYDLLEQNFGEGSIFRDVHSISPGVNFRKHIDAALSQCKALIAIINQGWENRLHNSDDYVRYEIEYALQREITVIPVLVDEARFPTARSLPSSLRKLASHQALKVRRDPDFSSDLESLTRKLKEVLSEE